MELVITGQLLASVRKEIRRSVVAPMGGAAAATMPAGSWLLVSLDKSSLPFGIGLAVTLSALLLMTGWR